MECFKWGLMSYPSRNLKDFVVDLNPTWPQLGSVEKNISMWHRDCFCGILVKNVAAFCPCLKSLPEAKIKRFILIALTKVSKQPGVKSVVWLLKLRLMKNILMKRSKLRKEKYKIYGLSIKGAVGSRMELDPMV